MLRLSLPDTYRFLFPLRRCTAASDNISLSSVWDVLELQKNDLCEYEEMVALQEGIECIANSKLLADIEHDLQVKATRSENEIFKDIEQIDQQIKELKGEKDAED